MLRPLFMFALLCLVVASVGWHEPAATPGPRSSTAGEEKPAPETFRLREGEVVELVGKLELSGDRAVFYPADRPVALRVLENLALQRITQVLSESRGDRQWLVSGVITEYRGGNYILITRAVQRARK